MALSYCWSRRSPTDHAELIRMPLSGWNVSQYDYNCPLRTRVDSVWWPGWLRWSLPLITESASLSKLHLERQIGNDYQHLMSLVPPKIPGGRMGQHPRLLSAHLCGGQSILEGGTIWLAFASEIWVCLDGCFKSHPLHLFSSPETIKAGSPCKPGSLSDLRWEEPKTQSVSKK